MVSVHKPVHSKITLTYSLTWQADRCTSWRMAFKALLNVKARPFPSLCLSFLCTYCSKKLPEWAPTKKQLHVLLTIDQLRAWAHRQSGYAQLSPLYPSLYPYVTHVINYSRPSPAFPYWKRRKAGQGLGTRLPELLNRTKNSNTYFAAAHRHKPLLISTCQAFYF